MRHKNGWVALDRKVSDGDLHDNPILFSIWTTLLLWATWKEQKRLVNGKQITLPPGSVVFGMREMASKWGVSVKTVHKWIHYLNDTGRVGYTGLTRGSVVTICNWEQYQRRGNTEVTRGEHEVNIMNKEQYLASSTKNPAASRQENGSERWLLVLSEAFAHHGVPSLVKSNLSLITKAFPNPEGLRSWLSLKIKFKNNAPPDSRGEWSGARITQWVGAALCKEAQNRMEFGRNGTDASGNFENHRN